MLALLRTDFVRFFAVGFAASATVMAIDPGLLTGLFV